MQSFTTEQEFQANAFAMALLMPETDYREQVKIHTEQNGRVNTAKIAEYFNVSVSTAAERGYELGLLEKWI